MTPALHAELIRRYPKFFREPGKRLVEPDPEDPSSSENHLEDDMGPYDEWGIECGDGWFALIDSLCQACEREIEGLIALGISNERWPRVAQIKEKWAHFGFASPGQFQIRFKNRKRELNSKACLCASNAPRLGCCVMVGGASLIVIAVMQRKRRAAAIEHTVPGRRPRRGVPRPH